MVQLPTLRELLDAGVHFGHKTSRWFPKMAPYIYTSKSGVHIINLEKTEEALQKAVEFVRREAAAGKTFVFVGTKKQSGSIIKEEASKASIPYVNIRWLGGTITNFEAIKGAIRRYKSQLEEIALDDAGKSEMTKSELSRVRKDVARGEKFLGGLVNLERKPDVLVLFGSHDEKIALKEAKCDKIPVIALVDTNANPEVVEYPIPANDDATKSVRLFASLFASVIKEARDKTKVVEENK